MESTEWITVQPNIGNDVRQEVSDWCYTTFKNRSNGDRNWFMTSNYTRELSATFDVVFKYLKDAEWFILRWGGEYNGI
jgi:hypothetical protein